MGPESETAAVYKTWEYAQQSVLQPLAADVAGSENRQSIQLRVITWQCVKTLYPW